MKTSKISTKNISNRFAASGVKEIAMKNNARYAYRILREEIPGEKRSCKSKKGR